METELKLRIDAASASAIKDLPALREHARGAVTEREQHDTYFDTSGLDLWRHGLAVRVRSTGGHHLQTVKDTGETLAGLHRRQEAEQEIPASAPDIALLRRQLDRVAPDCAHLVGHDNLALLPVFRNEVHRTLWTIALPTGEEIECALDIGALHAGAASTPCAELELELKQGDPARLYALAQEVHAAHPVRLENLSKAERGFDLAQRSGPAAVKAQPVALHRKSRLGGALADILANCLQQMQANEAGVMEGDAESLHQLRVGLRRLRAALDMVRDIAAPPEPVRADLDWLAGELGEARNWDVFIDAVLPGLLPPDVKDKDADPIRQAAGEEAQRHRQRVRNAVDSARYTALMLQLGGWIAERGWMQGEAAAAALRGRVQGEAGQLVRHASARTRKRARKLDLRDLACLHKVRIAAKKERYAREFFAAVRPGGKGRLKQLTDTQDELGALNDMRIAQGLLEQLKPRLPQCAAMLAYMEGVLAGRSEHAHQRARKRVRKAFG